MLTHDQSTSSPEEVETSRSTSHVTTSWDKRKNLAFNQFCLFKSIVAKDWVRSGLYLYASWICNTNFLRWYLLKLSMIRYTARTFFRRLRTSPPRQCCKTNRKTMIISYKRKGNYEPANKARFSNWIKVPYALSVPVIFTTSTCWLQTTAPYLLKNSN